jgi:hypothetical protein
VGFAVQSTYGIPHRSEPWRIATSSCIGCELLGGVEVSYNDRFVGEEELDSLLADSDG